MDTVFKSFADTSGGGQPPEADGRTTLQNPNPSTGMITQVPIRELATNESPSTPEWILVREIGFIDGPDGPFGYIGPDKPRPYSVAALDQILDELRQGSYQPDDAVDTFNRPLDVCCPGTTVFVFHLSNQRKWQFTRGLKAITLGFTDEVQGDNYYSLRHVVDDSIGTADPPPNGNCRIAYFTARKASEKFAHPFNINVELIYKTDIEGRNTLPIVIDPDVRFPGGSGS